MQERACFISTISSDGKDRHFSDRERSFHSTFCGKSMLKNFLFNFNCLIMHCLLRWYTVFHRMIYSKGSLLAEMFDPVVRSNHEFGIVAKIFGDLIPTDYDKDEVEREDDGKLTMGHFYIVYWFLFGSLVLTSTIFAIELLWTSSAWWCRRPKITINQVEPFVSPSPDYF